MATVTLRYWAAAKEAAGVAEERICAETLAAAIRAAGRQAPRSAAPGAAGRPGRAGRERSEPPPGEDAPWQSPRLRAVLARSSFLVDGTPVGVRAPETVPLPDGAVIEVLPPFAGG